MSRRTGRVLVTVTFGWAFSLDRSSPASTKRSSGASLQVARLAC